VRVLFQGLSVHPVYLPELVIIQKTISKKFFLSLDIEMQRKS